MIPLALCAADERRSPPGSPRPAMRGGTAPPCCRPGPPSSCTRAPGPARPRRCASPHSSPPCAALPLPPRLPSHGSMQLAHSGTRAAAAAPAARPAGCGRARAPWAATHAYRVLRHRPLLLAQPPSPSLEHPLSAGGSCKHCPTRPDSACSSEQQHRRCAGPTKACEAVALGCGNRGFLRRQLLTAGRSTGMQGFKLEVLASSDRAGITPLCDVPSCRAPASLHPLHVPADLGS